MHHLADDVFQLPGKPRNMINIYLIEDVLVDSGTPKAGKRIFQALGGRVPTSHLVTHAHPDHFGSSAEVCRKFDIPLLCGENDVDAVESGRPEASDTVVGRRILSKMPPIPGHPVSRRLKEGDMVGNFEVLDVPGHSRGHIAPVEKRGPDPGPGRRPVEPEPFDHEAGSSGTAEGPDPRPGSEPGLGPQAGTGGAGLGAVRARAGA